MIRKGTFFALLCLVVVSGSDASGRAVSVEVARTAPQQRDPVKSIALNLLPHFRGGASQIDFPCHHISLTLAKEAIEPGKVTGVEVDGKPNRDARFFNVGIRDPLSRLRSATGRQEGIEGETYEGRVDGRRDFRVIAPCNWTNESTHSIRVTMSLESGKEAVFERQTKAPETGGYWSGDWPHSVSITLRETVGVLRQHEPVHLSLGLFADDLTDPRREIRVVTYDPTHPKAGDDGYVVARWQVVSADQWRDEKLLATEEKDAKTGEPVHRYDPTVTVDLVFLADVLPYQEKVYQVLYGNPNAKPLSPQTDLRVSQNEGLGQTVATAHYRIGLATGSGAVETVTVLGHGKPVLLEHRLETNGAVHWNPGCYAPPVPWVHASDWENPEFEQITGPLMHRTRRYAPLPHMNSVTANISYTFYAGQPYMISSSVMVVQQETFVKALRNAEIVFNHAVLDEFVWMDHLGMVRSLEIGRSREHPLHALEIPPDTAWMAFINREKKVGFASIMLAYENTNVYGDPSSLAQPYIYVQNGPWIYWARGLVYPFGGMNFSRLMRVRKGSLYLEKNAYLPFRLTAGDNPFEVVERTQKQLKHPLVVSEWMATDERTPQKWVMPILTAPFDEGVEEAVGAQPRD